MKFNIFTRNKQYQSILFIVLTSTLCSNAAQIPLIGDWGHNPNLNNVRAMLGLWQSNEGTFNLDYTQDGFPELMKANAYSISEDIPIVGDWDSDGTETIAFYRPSTREFFFYNNYNNPISGIEHGNLGDIPLAGNWGYGASFGIYRPSSRTFWLYKTPESTTPFLQIDHGDAGDIPLVGDWDGNGLDGLAVYRPSNRTFYLYQEPSDAVPFSQQQVIECGNTPIIGDWNGDTMDQVGIFRESDKSFHFFNSNSSSITKSIWWQGIGNSDFYDNSIETQHVFYQQGAPHFKDGPQGITDLVEMTYDSEKSFFPIGLYGFDWETNLYQNSFDELHAAGFNTLLVPQNIEVQDPQKAQNRLDGMTNYIHQSETISDLKLILRYWGGVTEATLDSNWVTRFNAIPEIFGWYLRDEPFDKRDGSHPSHYNPCNEVQSQYDLANSLTSKILFHTDPAFNDDFKLGGSAGNLPTTGSHCGQTSTEALWNYYTNMGDMASLDYYPANYQDYLNKNFTNNVSEAYLYFTGNTIQQARIATSESKPILFVPQGFGNCEDQATEGGNAYQNHMPPTPTSYKKMVYTAIAYGATGIMTFAYDDKSQHDIDTRGLHPNINPLGTNLCNNSATNVHLNMEDLWNSLDASQLGFNKQLKDLQPFILNKTSSHNYWVFSQTPSSPIKTLLKQNGNKYLFIIVNPTENQLGKHHIQFQGDVDPTISNVNLIEPTNKLFSVENNAITLYNIEANDVLVFSIN